MYRDRNNVNNYARKTSNIVASIEPGIAPMFLKGIVLGLEPRIALEKKIDVALDIALGLTSKQYKHSIYHGVRSILTYIINNV